MKVACALATHLRAKVGMSRLPCLKYSPVVVVDRSPSRAGSVVVNRFPGTSGVMGVMRLAQAVPRRANAFKTYRRRVVGQLLASPQGTSHRVDWASLGTGYVLLYGPKVPCRGAGLFSTWLDVVPICLDPLLGEMDARSPSLFVGSTCGAFRALAASPALHTTFLLPLYEDQKDDMWTFHDRPDYWWYRRSG